jgi:hypothetical protein
LPNQFLRRVSQPWGWLGWVSGAFMRRSLNKSTRWHESKSSKYQPVTLEWR